MANKRMPVSDWMRKGLEEHGGDLLREMVAVFTQILMSTDVDAGVHHLSALPGDHLHGKGPARFLLPSEPRWTRTQALQKILESRIAAKGIDFRIDIDRVKR